MMPETSGKPSSPLAAENLANDPRINQAKELLLAAVAEHQSPLVGIRPPTDELVEPYRLALEAFANFRGGNLYFPYLASGIGNGPFVELADGSVKLDMITGIGVHGFGHSNGQMIAAGIDAAIGDTVMQGNLQQDGGGAEFSKLITDTACESGADLRHCFLSTSGAMANENALKMAFQAKQPANRIIAFEHCFAGRTLALSQVTDKPGNRVGLPDTIAVDYIPFFNANDPVESTRYAVSRLTDLLQRHPGKYAALWMELVQGEGGYYPGDQAFFEALIGVARENHVAVIADEVQSFGRTSRPFAFQHFNLDDKVDIVTIGKLTQVCATLFTPAMKPKPGLISQTFTGSSWAIAAGKTIVSQLIASGNFGADGRNVRLFSHFSSGLQRLADQHPDAISGPFGIGGMVVFTPYDGTAEKAKNLVKRMYDAGLMSFIAGGNPTRIRFLMPLGCVTHEHIDLAVDIIDSCL